MDVFSTIATTTKTTTTNNKQQTTNNKQLQDMNTCGLRGKDINLLRRPQPMPKRLGNDNIYPSPNQCKL
jgi:hypothetical protein